MSRRKNQGNGCLRTLVAAAAVLILIYEWPQISGWLHRPSQSAAALTGAAIPGLTAADVHSKLSAKGFAVMRGGTDAGQRWDCKRSDANADYEVVIAGRTYSDIITVQGSITVKKEADAGRLAGEFFGELASYAVPKADAAAARKWAQEAALLDARAIIGDVVLEIRGKSAGMKTLTLEGVAK